MMPHYHMGNSLAKGNNATETWPIHLHFAERSLTLVSQSSAFEPGAESVADLRVLFLRAQRALVP